MINSPYDNLDYFYVGRDIKYIMVSEYRGWLLQSIQHPKVRPPPETVQASYPHPSVGGSRGYPLSERQCAMHIRDWGHENDDTFGNLRDINSYPSKRSTHRWDWRRDEYGTLEAFEMSGNNPAIVLRGHM